jgi:molybdopterin molybdotransferase
MITAEEARMLLFTHVRTLGHRSVPLGEASGLFLAEYVSAPYPHPRFDNSAVDGYAFAFDAARDHWKVVGVASAGSLFPLPLEPGECVRIFTGAMLPQGADTVVMQEHVQRTGDAMTHTDERLRKGGNVRRTGEQIQEGEDVLLVGQQLTAEAIGLLASVGVRDVVVSNRPSVVVVVTGDEFADPGAPAEGTIFSSNDVMLQAALQREGLHCAVWRCRDDREALSRMLTAAALEHDLVITTGGVSVGDHDHVRPVLDALGATVHFHGVAQKPGKPMLFAALNGTPVFGLPGNPRAVMVLFWTYVLSYLRAMQRAADPGLLIDHLPIAHDVLLKGARAEYRAGRVHNGRVILLADEGSHMLRSLVDAEVLVYFPAAMRTVNADDPVEVHHLPR